MSDQPAPANPDPGQQDVGGAAVGPDDEVIRNWYGAVVEPRRLDRSVRQTRIAFGGLLAGAAFGGGLALVIHTIAQASPDAFPNGISGLVVLLLLVIGPLFGLGTGLMAGGLIPDDPVRAAKPPVPQR